MPEEKGHFETTIVDRFLEVRAIYKQDVLAHTLGCLIVHFDQHNRNSISKEDLVRILNKGLDLAEDGAYNRLRIQKEMEVRKQENN